MEDFVLVDDFRPPASNPPPSSASASASHYDAMFDSYFDLFHRPSSPSPSPSSSPPVFDKPVYDDDGGGGVDNPFFAVPPSTTSSFAPPPPLDGGDDDELLGNLAQRPPPPEKKGDDDAGDDPFVAIPARTTSSFSPPPFEGGDDDELLGCLTKPPPPPSEKKGDGDAGDDPFVATSPPMTSSFSAPPLVGSGDDLLGNLGKPPPQPPPPERKGDGSGGDDDFFENLGKLAPEKNGVGGKMGSEEFDDLIPGFGASSSSEDKSREPSVAIRQKEPIPSTRPTMSMSEDPFVILDTTSNSAYSSFGLFTDPLENIGRTVDSESTKVEIPSDTGRIFEDSDIYDTVGRRPLDNTNIISSSNHLLQKGSAQWASAEQFEDLMPEMQFSKSSDFHEAIQRRGSQTSKPHARNAEDQAPKGNQYPEMSDDAWLTVSDILLVTQPTSAPPPSRPPPPLVTKQQPKGSNNRNAYVPQPSQGYSYSTDAADKIAVSQVDELEDFAMTKPQKFANGHSEVLGGQEFRKDSSRAAMEAIDRAEAKHSKGLSEGESDYMFTRSNEWAYQEMDEKTKFHAYDMEDKEKRERSERERKQKEQEEERRRRERERQELEREREKARHKDEVERKRREKEREAKQAVEKAVREARERAAAEARFQAERQARQRAERAAVQRAAAEARERAAAEARERATKAAAEARERAAAEARERAAKAAAEARETAAAEARERAARAAAEARERAAAEARERAAKAAEEARERAAVEARERAAAEARQRAAAEARERDVAEARAKAERAAVEKVTAEARRRAERVAVERAAAEARQRAAAEARRRAAAEARERAAAEARAREKQQMAETDLESFFGMSSRASSEPPRPAPMGTSSNAQAQSGTGSGATRRTSSGSASSFMQASTTNNLMNDLSTIFGAPSSSVAFQEMEGESEERRKARFERHQRTLERAAKALAEKNERDLQIQREQEERHRIAATLDFEIKRWAAGKEGNLRALLSTLQYVLWPECGWRPVSLTDLITAASVKKEYRKATLCIHPDKVQQKGANLQQKYVAEKVFDLLKEAWNKFNSEELF